MDDLTFSQEEGRTMYQWIGFVGKILTGNHGFSYEIWGFPVSIFPAKPIWLAGCGLNPEIQR
jgi:hypothetical protein